MHLNFKFVNLLVTYTKIYQIETLVYACKKLHGHVQYTYNCNEKVNTNIIGSLNKVKY